MVRSLISLCFLLLPLLVGGSAAADVPKHPPGSICFTPQFWCWMQRPQYPGSVCFCPSPYGAVRGTAG